MNNTLQAARQVEPLQFMLEKVFGASVELSWKEKPGWLKFLVLSGKKAFPRWIIPANTCQAFEVLHQWKPYGFLSSLKWQVFLGAYQAGLADYVPGVQIIFIKTAQDGWQHLGQSKPLVPIIYVGTPSAIGKLVPTLVDKITGTPVTVAKIPYGSVAGNNILREADMLMMLAGKFPELAPKVMYTDTETCISTQTFVTGSPASTVLKAAHIEVLKKLAIDLPKVTAFDILNHLKERLMQSIPDEPQREAGAHCIEYLLETHSALTLPQVIVHGDFSPWNIREKKGGSLLLLDWEDGKACGLPFYDLVHFHVIQDYTVGRRPTSFEKLLKIPLVRIYLEHLQLSDETAELLYLYYFLDFWCRHWEQNDTYYANMFYDYAHTVWEVF